MPILSVLIRDPLGFQSALFSLVFLSIGSVFADESISWHVGIGDEIRGPFEHSKIEAMITSGEIGKETLMWHKGLSDWKKAEFIPEFADRLTPAASPPKTAPAPPPLPQKTITQDKPTPKLGSSDPTMWFAAIAGKRAGPYTTATIKTMIGSKKISADVVLWNKSMSNWEPASTVDQFKILFASVPPNSKPESSATISKVSEKKAMPLSPVSTNTTVDNQAEKTVSPPPAPVVQNPSNTRIGTLAANRSGKGITISGAQGRNPNMNIGAYSVPGAVSGGAVPPPQVQSGSTPPSGSGTRFSVRHSDGNTQTSASPIGATNSKLSAADGQALVDYHNEARREVGSGDVTWSAEIAAHAQEWADHIARTGRYEHRPPEQRLYGENLASGTTGAYTVLTLAGQWYAEKPLYQAGTPFSSAQMRAGHYTQMVWRGSTRIGAGIAVCKVGRMAGMTVLVCNYAPQGNITGDLPF